MHFGSPNTCQNHFIYCAFAFWEPNNWPLLKHRNGEPNKFERVISAYLDHLPPSSLISLPASMTLPVALSINIAPRPLSRFLAWLLAFSKAYAPGDLRLVGASILH